MTPATITLGMKIGMGISGIMLAGGIIMLAAAILMISADMIRVRRLEPPKMKSIESCFRMFLLLSVSAICFLGSIAVKIHMWMWTAG